MVSSDSDHRDPKPNIDKCPVWQNSEIPTIAEKLYSAVNIYKAWKNVNLFITRKSVELQVILTAALT